MLQIRCKNNNITKSFPEGTSLIDVYQEFENELHLPYPVVSAKVNNTSQGLKFRVYQNRDVEFIDACEGSGRRVYVRSLCFVLYKATNDVFPSSKLFIEHPLSRGYYCNFKKRGNEPLTDEDVERISQRMQEIIDMDLPFRRTEATIEEAIRVFKERGFVDKVKLLETSGQVYSYYYTLGDTVDYYYGPLVPSAGYLKVWKLERYQDGLLLRVPDKHNPMVLAEKVDMPKTFGVFAEKVRWDIIMRLSNAGDVNKAVVKGFEAVKSDHLKAHHELFDRVELVIGNPEEKQDLTLEDHWKDFLVNDDPWLPTCYFHYGRYLLISSTREDLLPPNLQGLWANTIKTPWNGDYHLNINLEMNHWPCEVCNLSELHLPLIHFAEGLMPSGQKTARDFYGARGWTAHVVCNPWGFTAPGEHPSWGATNTGGAWLALHAWQHYEFTHDTTFLLEAYPLMKEAAWFFLDAMIEEPEHGWLVTAPTTSPENAF